MAGKTKTIILEEKIKEQELINYESKIDVEKLKVLNDIIQSCTYSTKDCGTVLVNPALNDKGRDIVASKIIALVKKM